MQENSCEHRKKRYFPKVQRTVDIGKTSVCLHSRAFAVRENARKVLSKQEHTIISVRLPNGEHWKIYVFSNSLKFLKLNFSENTRKQEKTSVNEEMHYAFRTLTEQSILEKSVFCEIERHLLC